MSLRWLRPVSAPRTRITAMDSDDILARWLAATDLARADATGRRIWQIYDTPAFAELWYAARDAGERMRARAVGYLYGNRQYPGGRYPDPREQATFSERAILSTAANQIPIQVWQMPSTTATTATVDAAGASVADVADMADVDEPAAWLITHPRDANGVTPPPQIMLHAITPAVPEARILFEMACLLGFITKEPRMLDPDAPHGVTMMPTNPSILSLLHQFAIALLCLDPDCPEDWTCQCNDVRRRYNAPPATHDQPTDVLNREDLRRATPRLRTEC